LQELHNKLDSLSKEDFDKVWAKYHQKEEPVSIWHDSSEEPNDKSSCLIHYIVDGEVSYRDIFPVLYNKKAREFVSESYPHPTGYKVEQSSLEGGVVAEVYKGMRDRFPISDIYKWAYIDDILNLSNVQRITKDWKESVSEELEKEVNKYLHALYSVWTAEQRKEDFLVEELCTNVARHFANWQKANMMAKAIDVEVKVDAGGYPYIPQMELYDYDKDIPLAKEGDKYKVIILKE
jgi:hypothetical protein